MRDYVVSCQGCGYEDMIAADSRYAAKRRFKRIHGCVGYPVKIRELDADDTIPTTAVESDTSKRAR